MNQGFGRALHGTASVLRQNFPKPWLVANSVCAFSSHFTGKRGWGRGAQRTGNSERLFCPRLFCPRPLLHRRSFISRRFPSLLSPSHALCFPHSPWFFSCPHGNINSARQGAGRDPGREERGRRPRAGWDPVLTHIFDVLFTTNFFFFCINFENLKYCIRILFILITEFFGAKSLEFCAPRECLTHSGQGVETILLAVESQCRAQ